MTFQIHVELGTWQQNVPDPLNNGNPANGFYPSTFEMWVARDGEESRITHRFTNILIRRGTGSDDPNYSSHSAEYGKLWFTTYNTGKSASETHQEASTWYDELIVSTRRIADPSASSVRPSPPSDLRTTQ